MDKIIAEMRRVAEDIGDSSPRYTQLNDWADRLAALPKPEAVAWQYLYGSRWETICADDVVKAKRMIASSMMPADHLRALYAAPPAPITPELREAVRLLDECGTSQAWKVVRDFFTERGL